MNSSCESKKSNTQETKIRQANLNQRYKTPTNVKQLHDFLKVSSESKKSNKSMLANISTNRKENQFYKKIRKLRPSNHPTLYIYNLHTITN